MSAIGRVLVVDDDTDVRESIEEVLRDTGYETYGAENGRAALAAIDRIPSPCLVLLDLMMPEINGWEVLNELRAQDRLVHFPVVVMSAVKPELMPTGVPWLRKPFELEVLLEAVRRHCK